MKRFCLFLCGLCVVSGIALAQGKSNVQWKCDKPAVQHTINVGDKPGHAYAIDQINCTAIKGEMAGVKIGSSSRLEATRQPVTANSSKTWRTETRTTTGTNSRAHQRTALSSPGATNGP